MPGVAQSEEGHSAKIVLGILESIEEDGAKSQRRLAADLGIALGLVNLYLKRCVRKGLLKVSEAPMRRYAYYLTPQGFSEKARLTGEYLSGSLEFFRKARKEATGMLEAARARGARHVVFVGAGDFAEVAILSALDANVGVAGILDADWPEPRCAGHDVFNDPAALSAALAGRGVTIDAIMVTASRHSFAAVGVAEAVAKIYGVPFQPEFVLLPKALKLSWPVREGEGRP
ncbi:MAG TPA: winged helix-turn-helix transcriptional regulator [Xanthobacteraceae bacterium]|nr:winged helix-turn-helix transcriptional regulator [Xanthobacteraceae bacterium]